MPWHLMVLGHQQALLWLKMVSSNFLTHTQLEMYGGIVRTAATDAMVLKHQAINMNSAD